MIDHLRSARAAGDAAAARERIADAVVGPVDRRTASDRAITELVVVRACLGDDTGAKPALRAVAYSPRDSPNEISLQKHGHFCGLTRMPRISVTR